MRTYEDIKILNSYSKYLSSHGNIDLYIYTWKNKGYSNRHGHTNYNIKQNDVICKNDLIDHYSKIHLFTIKDIIIEDFDVFYNSLSISMEKIYNTPFRNHSVVTTSVPIEYKYQQAIRSLYTMEYTKYNNIMILRPDMELLCDIPIEFPQEDVIYFKNVCNRCVDHCWFGTPNTLIKQLYNIYDNYETNSKIITSEDQNNRDNNELLIYQCNKNNINIEVQTNGNFVRQSFY
jgi:hypothetical protein